MKQVELITRTAGIDVSKAVLDVAVFGLEDICRLANDEAGLAELETWLRARGVTRVGLEASGSYHRAAVAWLREAGFEVVVHQPQAVKHFARFKGIKAKNDRIDARIIAAATAQVEAVKAANDQRLTELAERLTAYEQVTDQLAQLKTMVEHLTLEDLKAGFRAQMATLRVWKRSLRLDLLRRIKAEPDLNRRYQLLNSLPGLGALIAAAILVRMPELGELRHGQAAALIGVAPYDHDSGTMRGHRFIWGGRARARRFLYLAALTAKRCDPGFKAFVAGMLARGKPPKIAIIALMRKLIEQANLVLERGTPWIAQPSAKT